MEVRNNSSNNLVAFVWHVDRGRSASKVIKIGETKELPGIYLGETEFGKCYLHQEGLIVCQDTPNDEYGFQVTPDTQLDFNFGKQRISIRKYFGEEVI